MQASKKMTRATATSSPAARVSVCLPREILPPVLGYASPTIRGAGGPGMNGVGQPCAEVLAACAVVWACCAREAGRGDPAVSEDVENSCYGPFGPARAHQWIG